MTNFIIVINWLQKLHYSAVFSICEKSVHFPLIQFIQCVHCHILVYFTWAPIGVTGLSLRTGTLALGTTTWWRRIGAGAHARLRSTSTRQTTATPGSPVWPSAIDWKKGVKFSKSSEFLLRIFYVTCKPAIQIPRLVGLQMPLPGYPRLRISTKRLVTKRFYFLVKKGAYYFEAASNVTCISACIEYEKRYFTEMHFFYVYIHTARGTVLKKDKFTCAS